MSGARRVAIALGVVALLGASGIVCARVAERGRWALPYSTYGSGPEGTRALFLLAAEEGLAPSRWHEDLGALPDGGTLVALGGCEHLASRRLARPERERLVSFIESGGVLIVAGAPDYLPDELGVSLEAPSFEECLGQSGVVGTVVRAWQRAGAPPDGGVEGADGGVDPLGDLAPDRAAERLREASGPDAPPPLETVTPRAAPLAGMGAVGLRRSARVVVRAGVEATTLLAREDGEPAAVAVRRGEGRVFVVASASALQNRDLELAEGAVLFARLARAAGGGPVRFDEYHLGAGERRTFMRWVAEAGLLPIALQGVIVALLFLWTAGAAFGAPRRALAERTEPTSTFVGAIGALFAKSQDPAGALAILARHAIARVAAHHRLDAREAAAVSDALRRRKRVEAADAVLAIAALGRAPGGARIDLARTARAIDAEVARATRETV